MLRKIKDHLFSNKDLRQTILKNSFWIGLSIFVGRTIRAIVIIYAARILGTEGYGIFSYAMSVAAFFSIFSDIGLTSLVTREIAKDPERKDDYVTTVFFLKIGILIVTLVATIFLAPYFVKIEAVKPLIPLAAILVIFDNLRIFGFGFARAKEQMEKEGILSIGTDILITIFSLYILFSSPSPFNLALMYVIGSLLGTIVTFLFLRKFLFHLSGRFNPKIIKTILSVAIPFAVMGIFSALMINIDMVILGIFKNTNELGLYAAAQRPILLLYTLPAIIATSIFPIVSKLAHVDNGKAKMVLEKSISAILLVALPIFVGGIVLSYPIIRFFFGTAYEDATLSFQILLSTILLVFPGGIIGNSLFSYNMEKKLMLASGLGATTNVLLDLILIPPLGINGSAIATLTSQIVLNGICFFGLKKQIPFGIKLKIPSVFLSLFFMTISSYLLYSIGVHVILNIIISGIVYVIALVFTKEPLALEGKQLVTTFKKNIPAS